MARTKHEEASIRGQSWVSASYVPPIAVLGVAAFIRRCHRMLSIQLIEIMDDTGFPENPNKQFKRQPAEQRGWGLYVFPEPPCVGAAICCADDVAMQVGKLASHAVVIAPRGLEITYFHLRSWTSSINARTWQRSSKWSNKGRRFKWDKPKAGDKWWHLILITINVCISGFWSTVIL